MTLEEIRELIDLVAESGIAELEVQRGENRVRIRRSFDSQVREIVVAANPPPAGTSSTATHGPSTPSTARLHGKTAPAVEKDEPGQILVKAPIVGTFYEAASPGSKPFIAVGDKVEPGKVLCIIESMKLMNEIEAEVAGVVEAKLVENGQPVEYGEALFAIRPV